MPQNRVIVIIPIYKTNLNRWEEASLRQCIKVLGRHPIAFAAPAALDTTLLEERSGIRRVERFADSYFCNLSGYNRLMLDPEFYERFLEYEYLLIHQLDAYVFSDQLEAWCDRGYDYIGAPWIPSIKYQSPIRRTELVLNQLLMRAVGSYNTRSNYFHTGNGGFSLRRVAACLDVVKSDRQEIERFLARGSYHYAEDVYWSIRANRVRRRLQIPQCREALDFAFENLPEQLYEHNGHRLPFGTHAWYKGDRLEFWRRFIDLPEESE